MEGMIIFLVVVGIVVVVAFAYMMKLVREEQASPTNIRKAEIIELREDKIEGDPGAPEDFEGKICYGEFFLTELKKDKILAIKAATFDRLKVGDKGILTFRGERYMSFQGGEYMSSRKRLAEKFKRKK